MNVNRRVLIGASAGAVAAGLASRASAETERRGGGKAERKALDALRAYIEQHRADWGIPGMTLAVVTREGFAGFVRSGLADVDKEVPVRPDHLFQIGSISKMFTALAAYSLIEEGKLSPDVRLEEALKGVTVRGGKAITLQHLLNHTSGLPADSAIFPVGGLWTGFPPGKGWSYSNSGYQLAGMIAEAADGRLYSDMIKARVLDRLGMENSVAAMRVADRPRYAQGYEPALTDRLNARPGPMTPTPWVDSDSPAGCIAATAGDMAIFMRFLLDLAAGKGAGVFSDETARRFLADPAEAPGWAPGAKYGNGVAHLERYLLHTGGMVSFCSCLHVDPEAGVAAFASANVHYSLNYRPRDVTLYACNLMRAIRDGSAPPTPKPTRPVVEKAGKFSGTFTAANGGAFEIIGADGKVRMRRDGRMSDMQAAAPTLFVSGEPDFAVTGVVIDVESDKAARAWIGETEYAADPAAGYRPPAPPELRALAGRYDNDDRWGGPLYVYARDGRLFIGNSEPLSPLKDGEWRLGDDASPERIRFEGFVNGRPQVLLFSGVPYVRRFS